MRMALTPSVPAPSSGSWVAMLVTHCVVSRIPPWGSTDTSKTLWKSCGTVPHRAAELDAWLQDGGDGLVAALRRTKGGNAMTVIRQDRTATARRALAGTGLQSRAGHRHVAERRPELERGSALAPKASAARVAVPVVRDERRGLGADDALLNATEQLPGLGERQSDLLELIMRLVEYQNLLVTGTVVTGIDTQPDLDLHDCSASFPEFAERKA